MAVSVDTVYQRVLALANKEQRGYITPQEFNLFADQAQMEIFDQYFYDLGQFKRRLGSETKLADLEDLIEEKIAGFVETTQAHNGTNMGNIGDFYRLNSVYLSKGNTYAVLSPVEQVTVEEMIQIEGNPLTKPTNLLPVFRFSNHSFSLKPYPNPLGNYYAYYTRKPKKPKWGYVVVKDKALYNANASTDFELHASEESELVYRILLLAGIAIEKPQLAQVSAGLAGGTIQQQKQQ